MTFVAGDGCSVQKSWPRCKPAILNSMAMPLAESGCPFHKQRWMPTRFCNKIQDTKNGSEGWRVRPCRPSEAPPSAGYDDTSCKKLTITCNGLCFRFVYPC